jgi:hypothetical protein
MESQSMHCAKLVQQCHLKVAVSDRMLYNKPPPTFTATSVPSCTPL